MTQKEKLQDLCKVLCSITNEKECMDFLQDLCTQKEMENMAEIDGMTGLYNKSKYLDMISNEYLNVGKLAVIFWDINYLKKIKESVTALFFYTVSFKRSLIISGRLLVSIIERYSSMLSALSSLQ